MGDKRKLDEVAVDENDEAVVDIAKTKKIKSGDKEKSKDKKKEKKDKKDKKDKKEKKEKKRKSKEENVKDEETKPDEEPELLEETVKANGMNGTADEDAMDVDGQQNGAEKAEKSKKEKKEKKEKKNKKEKKEKKSKGEGEVDKKKEKKQKKKLAEQEEKKEEGKEKANGAEEVAEPTAVQPETDTPAENGIEAAEGAVGDAEIDAAQKSQRFIVFISNLPYSATQESVAKHFEKLQPSSVRVPLERCGKKGRGFAFIEFSAFDRMKTCLKQYHGTMFEDGKKPARKIKVELTAGGGGSKSEARKMKILEKNQKLNEERARDAQEAKKAKAASATNGAAAADDQSHIHPSRRARVPV